VAALAGGGHGSTLASRDGYRGPVLALVLVALALGLSNFAAAVGIFRRELRQFPEGGQLTGAPD
jgi:hypothetical protein